MFCCVICVSCSVHLISTYYVGKGSYAFLSTNQQVGKSYRVCDTEMLCVGKLYLNICASCPDKAMKIYHYIAGNLNEYNTM